MKHITSKLLSLLLTLAMLLSIIPAAYAEGTEGTTEVVPRPKKSSPRTARRPPRPKRSTAARP